MPLFQAQPQLPVCPRRKSEPLATVLPPHLREQAHIASPHLSMWEKLVTVTFPNVWPVMSFKCETASLVPRLYSTSHCKAVHCGDVFFRVALAVRSPSVLAWQWSHSAITLAGSLKRSRRMRGEIKWCTIVLG